MRSWSIDPSIDGTVNLPIPIMPLDQADKDFSYKISPNWGNPLTDRPDALDEFAPPEGEIELMVRDDSRPALDHDHRDWDTQ